MADTVETRWIYPPNWNGFLPDQGGFRRVIVQFLNSSDGTGESSIIKLDLSSLQNTLGETPTRSVVEKIVYHTSGMGVKIEWDRAPRPVIAYIPSGESGTLVDDNVDPGEDGDRTGDILFTTIGADAGDTYDITLTVRLK